MSMAALTGAGRRIRQVVGVLAWPFRRLARRAVLPFYLRFKSRFYEDMTAKIDDNAVKWERRLAALVCEQQATARRLARLEDHVEALMSRQAPASPRPETPARKAS